MGVSTVGSIILSIVILGIIILVHECGHYIVGRIFHFPISEFAIGYGPKLISKEKSGIVYSLRAVPLGGYVAFAEEEDGSGVLSEGKKFYEKPKWQRVILMAAGSVMNLLLAMVIIFFVYFAVGFATVGPIVDSVTPGSPAEQAQLMSGDEIIKVDDTDINGDVDALYTAISAHEGEPLTVIVARGDEQVTKNIIPVYDEESQSWKIGITLGYNGARYRSGFFESIKYTCIATWQTITGMLAFFRNLFFKGEGAGDVSSVVGAINIMSSAARDYDLSYYLALVASLSINLSIINLFPIPPLDGSKILFIVVEAIRGKRIPPQKEGIVHVIGFVLMIILAVVLMYRDILNIIRG